MAGTSVVEAATSEASDTWIRVELNRAFSGYRAVISVRGRRQGTRTIDDVGPACASLADAVAITLVMLLDPELERSGGAEAPPSVAVRPAVPLRSRASSLPPPPPASPLRFGAELAAGLSFMVLDGTAPFAEGGARLQLGDAVSFGAGGGYVFSDRLRFGTGSIDLELAYGYLRGCVLALSGARVRLELCLEPMLGSLRGGGNEYDDIQSRHVAWPAVAALAEIYGPLTSTAFWSLRALALAPLVKQQGFSVTEAGERKRAFEVPAAGGMLAAGVRADF